MLSIKLLGFLDVLFSIYKTAFVIVLWKSLYDCDYGLSLSESVEPSLTPTISPSIKPTFAPSVKPTLVPSCHPTSVPSMKPVSVKVSSVPMTRPIPYPTMYPTAGIPSTMPFFYREYGSYYGPSSTDSESTVTLVPFYLFTWTSAEIASLAVTLIHRYCIFTDAEFDDAPENTYTLLFFYVFTKAHIIVVFYSSAGIIGEFYKDQFYPYLAPVLSWHFFGTLSFTFLLASIFLSVIVLYVSAKEWEIKSIVYCIIGVPSYICNAYIQTMGMIFLTCVGQAAHELREALWSSCIFIYIPFPFAILLYTCNYAYYWLLEKFTATISCCCLFSVFVVVLMCSFGTGGMFLIILLEAYLIYYNTPVYLLALSLDVVMIFPFMFVAIGACCCLSSISILALVYPFTIETLTDYLIGDSVLSIFWILIILLHAIVFIVVTFLLKLYTSKYDKALIDLISDLLEFSAVLAMMLRAELNAAEERERLERIRRVEPENGISAVAYGVAPVSSNSFTIRSNQESTNQAESGATIYQYSPSHESMRDGSINACSYTYAPRESANQVGTDDVMYQNSPARDSQRTPREGSAQQSHAPIAPYGTVSASTNSQPYCPAVSPLEIPSSFYSDSVSSSQLGLATESDISVLEKRRDLLVAKIKRDSEKVSFYASTLMDLKSVQPETPDKQDTVDAVASTCPCQ